MSFRLCYPHFKKKAVCFSYDDGILQDRELVALFKKHGMRATFNLVPGSYGAEKFRLDKEGVEVDCSHLSLEESISLYKGMEIANHTLSHPWLNLLPESGNELELGEAKSLLEKQYGQKVDGVVYPFGAYGAETLKVLEKMGTLYARTTRSTYRFGAPSSYLAFHPTIHHRDPLLKETMQAFYRSEDELPLCFIWGHAYEFAIDRNFKEFDALLEEIEGHEDVLVLPVGEAVRYQKAAGLVHEIKRPEFHYLVNPSELDVYVLFEGREIKIPGNGKVDL